MIRYRVLVTIYHGDIVAMEDFPLRAYPRREDAERHVQRREAQSNDALQFKCRVVEEEYTDIYSGWRFNLE